jgi:4-carboxymuconolactone decarboxylase
VSADGDASDTSFDARTRRGRGVLASVTGFPVPESDQPFMAVGVHACLFGEVWSRPGLERKERRWITLACAAAVGSESVEGHIRAALASGDISHDELQEFVLHVAFYAGFAIGSSLSRTVARIEGELAANGELACGPGGVGR